MSDKSHDHFQGKSAFEHLKEARKKGKSASSEIHGAEPSGFFTALSDSAREIALYLSLLVILLLSIPFQQSFMILCLFSLGLILWKAGRSAYFGWARIERLNHLIEEENFEIQNHREQEKEELSEIYKARGFKGKQLEEVIEVLMADDNRLLQVMLEEELGVKLEVLEHPLRLAFASFIGSFVSSLIILTSTWFFGVYGTLGALFCITLLTGVLFAKNFKNDLTKGYIWNLALIFLSLGVVYFLNRFLNGLAQ